MQKEYFSVEEFLQMDSVKGAVVLTTKQVHAKQIKRINVVENDAMEKWAEPGDMVLTTGHPFHGNMDILKKHIQGLKDRGVDCMGIKDMRTKSLLTEEVLDFAGQLDFTLVLLPMQSVFSNIVLESMEQILIKESEVFRKAQTQMDALLDVICQEEDLAHSVSDIEACLENPVVVIDKYGDFFSGRLGRRRILPYIKEELPRRLVKEKEYDIIRIKMGKEPVDAFFGRLAANNGNPGFIVVFASCRSLRQSDILTIRYVSKILSLEVRNTEVLKKIKAKYRDRFVQNWILGEFGNEADIALAANADGYQFDVGGKFRVAILAVSKGSARLLEREEEINMLSRGIRELCMNVMFTIYEGKVIFVMEENREKLNLAPLISKLKYIYARKFVCLCLSEAYCCQQVPIAYLEVKKVLFISEKCSLKDEIVTRKKLGIFSLLALLPDVSAISDYKDQFLKPLKEYDQIHRTQLWETLSNYLESDGNMKETAERMFTHYNTIPYRLERIKQILDMDIGTVENKLQLLIAYKLDLME